MEILNILVFVLCLNLLSSERAFCKISKEDPRNFSIDPLIMLYISDHTKPQECIQLYTFLVNTTFTASKHHSSVTENGTSSYQDFIKNSPSKMQGQEGEFPCLSSLKHWNFLVKSLEYDELEERKYVETMILVALHKINRNDLHVWMEKVITDAQHDEIKHFEKELKSIHSNLSKKHPKRHSFEEEEAESVMAVSFICFLLFIGLSSVLISYICIALRLRPQDYIPLKTTNSHSNESRRLGDESRLGYYSSLTDV